MFVLVDGKIFIFQEIGFFGLTAQSIADTLENDKSKDITLYINSPGGEVFEGYAIYNVLKTSGRNIEAHIMGQCASIATLIALAANKVVISEKATWMIHNPFVGIQGDAKKLEQSAKVLRDMEDTLVAEYAKKTGEAEDVIRQWMDEEKFFTGSEAVEVGFADEIEPELKAVAYVGHKNNKTMSKETDGLMKSILSKLNRFLAKSEPKAMAVELEDGSKIWVESEDGELEGKNAWTTDGEGNPTDTPAPDGDHKLIDGRTITIEGGVVTAVKESEMENLKKELAEAKAANEQLTTELTEAKTLLAEATDSITKLQASVAGDPKPPGSTPAAARAKARQSQAHAGAQPVTGRGAWAENLFKERGINRK